MQKTLKLIVHNFQHKIPPDDEENLAIIECLRNAARSDTMLIDIRESLLLFCLRISNKEVDLPYINAYKEIINWLIKVILSELSSVQLESSNDIYYALRMLLTNIETPDVVIANLCELTSLHVDEKDVDTSIPNDFETSQTAPVRLKARKAAIATELWDDITSSLSLPSHASITRDGDEASASISPVTVQTYARLAFWKNLGHKVLLTHLNSIARNVKGTNESKQLATAIERSIFLCQILKGALCETKKEQMTVQSLTSLPTLFVDEWIKGTFRLFATTLEPLANHMFSRITQSITIMKSNSPPSTFSCTQIIPLMNELHATFSDLFVHEAGGGAVECFERDVAELWLSLRIISAFYQLSSPPDQPPVINSILTLTISNDGFGGDPSSLIELSMLLLRRGLKNAAMFDRMPWQHSDDETEVTQDNISTSDWCSRISAYERFILEPRVRSAFVMAGSPLDLFLLDLASTFFTASGGTDNTGLSTNLIDCSQRLLSTIVDLMQLRQTQTDKTMSGSECDKLFGIHLADFLNDIHQRQQLDSKLADPLTALFFFLANSPGSIGQTRITTALNHLSLIGASPRCTSPHPLAFRLLAAYLLAMSQNINKSNDEDDAIVAPFCSTIVARITKSEEYLSPEMAQLISLLSSAFSSLNAKKTFLQTIVNSLLLNSGPDEDCQRRLRLLVLLRYQMHYFFDPPRHLNMQIRPALLGNKSEGLVWQFPDLKDFGCFYDLLLPCPTLTAIDGSNTNTIPPVDGLAIMTLLSRPDYDAVFSGLLCLLNSAILGQSSTSQPLAVLSNALYALNLNWRLLEFLPPAPDFCDRLSAKIDGLNKASTSTKTKMEEFIYLLVLFDRLKRCPTAPPANWQAFTSSSSGNENTTRVKHSSARCTETISNQVLKARCSRNSNLVGKTETPSTRTAFVGTSDLEGFFIALRSPSLQSMLLLEAGVDQLEDFKRILVSSSENVLISSSGLVYWCSLFHLLTSLYLRMHLAVTSSSNDSTHQRPPPPPLPNHLSSATINTKTPRSLLPTSSSSSSAVKAIGELIQKTSSAKVCSMGVQSPTLISEPKPMKALPSKKIIKARICQLSEKLLFICVDLLDRIHSLIRAKIGLIPSSLEENKRVNGKVMKLADSLSLLCATRLSTVSPAGSILLAPATTARLSSAIAAAVKRSTDLKHSEALKMMKWNHLLSTTGTLSLTTEQIACEKTYSLSQSMFSHLSLGLHKAISTSSADGDTSDEHESLQLLLLGSLFQATCALAQASAGHLVSADADFTTSLMTSHETEKTTENANISCLVRIHMDPVTTSLGVDNLMQSPLVDLFTHLALVKQNNDRKKEKKDSSCAAILKLCPVSKRKHDRLVRVTLENRVLDVVVSGFAVGQAPVDFKLHHFLTQLQTESFGFLEVALDFPRIVRMCLKDDASKSPNLPLLNIFTMPKTTNQSISYICAQVRLLGFILMRAISPRCSPALFSKLAKEVLSVATSSLLTSLFTSLTTIYTDNASFFADEDALQLDLLAGGETAMKVQETVRSIVTFAIQQPNQQQHCLSTTSAGLAAPDRLKTFLRLWKRRRLNVLTECLLRLIAAPGWCIDGANEHSKICLEIFDKAIETWNHDILTDLTSKSPQSLLPLIQSLPLVVSGLRCLALSCPYQGGDSVHLRLADLFTCWVQPIVDLLNSDNQQLDSSVIQNELLLSLRAIFDYFNLLSASLLSENEEDNIDNDHDKKTSLLPDSRYWQTLKEATAKSIPCSTSFHDFFVFQHNLQKEGSIQPGDAWNMALDAFLRDALCGPVLPTGSPNFNNNNNFFSSFFASEFGMEEVCSFASTQNRFVEQPWYGCYTCDMVTKRGVCHLCASVCHHGHQVIYNTTSEFFCDCAAELSGPGGRCCAVTRQINRHAQRQSLFSSFLPWTNSRLPKTMFANAYKTLNAASTIDANLNGSNVGMLTLMATHSQPTDIAPLPISQQHQQPISSRIRRMGAIRRKVSDLRQQNEQSTQRTTVQADVVHQPTVTASQNSTLPPTMQPPIPISILLHPGERTVSPDKLTHFNRLWRRNDEVNKFSARFSPTNEGEGLKPHFNNVVSRIRDQIASSNDRLELLNRLLNSKLLSIASQLYSKAIKSSFSVPESIGVKAMRSAAVERLLSVQRSFSPTPRLSFQITMPVLLLSASEDEIWKSVIQVSQGVHHDSNQSKPPTPKIETTESSSPTNPAIIPPRTGSLTTMPNILSSGFRPRFSSVNTARSSTTNVSRLPSLLSLGHEAFLLELVSNATNHSRLSNSLFSRLLATNPSSMEALQLIRNSVEPSQQSQRKDSSTGSAVIALARVPAASNGEWRHYLLVGGTHGGRLFSNEQEVNVYAVDDLLRTAAACQADTDLQMLLMHAFSGLLSIDNNDHAEEAAGHDSLSSKTNMHADKESMPQPFVVPLTVLPRVGTLDLGFEFTKILVHPDNEAIFTINNSLDVCVMGMSSIGQVCGRVTITPYLEDKDEVLIRPIWLPNSCRYLALLTTQSVQIFDIFETTPKPLFHFKPVEGKFCDASFIYLPNRKENIPASSTFDEDSKMHKHELDLSDMHLAVMATFGSVLVQRLTSDTQMTKGQFYLADWLDWDPTTLSGDDSSLQRDPRTGTLGSGGVSVFYASSLGLLIHSYHSGHTVASALSLDHLKSTVSPNSIKINYSFLITDSTTTPSASLLLTTTTSHAENGAIFDSPTTIGNGGFFSSAITQLTESVNAQSKPAASSAHEKDNVLPEAKKASSLPWSGPLTGWTEVRGHQGLLTAVAVDPGMERGCHRHILVAVEPDNVFVQPLPINGLPLLSMYNTDLKIDQEQQNAQSNADNETTAKPDNRETKTADTTAVKTKVASRIINSLTSFWTGSADLESRSFTLQLTSDGNLQVFATHPSSRTHDVANGISTAGPHSLSVDSFALTQNLPSTQPGQFWLQPAICSTVADKLPNSISAQMSPLELGLMWELFATSRAPYPRHSGLEKMARAVTSLPILKHILEVTNALDKNTAYDFHEWSTSTDNVAFSSKDLLAIYNHEILRQRLLQPNTPVTYAGRSLATEQLSSTSADHDQSTLKRVSPNVAFVINIETSHDEVIVGLRVELATKGVKEDQRPCFLSVFGRKTDLQLAGSNVNIFDIPLTLAEMLDLDKSIRLCVGRSINPDGLTSIDCISVFTVPRASIDASPFLAISTCEEPTSSTVIFSDIKKSKRVCAYNSALSNWMDRTLATGFITTMKRLSTNSTVTPSQFTTPTYDSKLLEGLKGTCPDFNGLLCTLCDFFATSLDTGKLQMEKTDDVSIRLSLVSMVRELEPLTLSALDKQSYSASPLTSRLINLSAALSGYSTTIWSALEAIFQPITSNTDLLPILPTQLSAICTTLSKAADAKQLAHEYALSHCSTSKMAPSLSLINKLQRAVGALEVQIEKGEEGNGLGLSLLAPRLQQNRWVVEFLQPFVKIVFFFLTEASLDEGHQSEVALTSILINLLMHTNDQISCNARDLLCSYLMCLFPGNQRLASSLFEPPTPPNEPPKPALSTEDVNQPISGEEKKTSPPTPPAAATTTSRHGASGSGLRRWAAGESSRSRRIGLVESDLEVLGMEMAELLNLLSEDDSRRLRLSDTQAELRELQAVTAELQRRDRLQRRHQQETTGVRSENISYMDEFSEEDDEGEDVGEVVGSQRPSVSAERLFSDSLNDGYNGWSTSRHSQNQQDEPEDNAEEDQDKDDEDSDEQDEGFNIFCDPDEEDDDYDEDDDDDDDEEEEDQETETVDPPREFVYTDQREIATSGTAAVEGGSSSATVVEESDELEHQLARILIQCLQQQQPENNSASTSEQHLERRHNPITSADDNNNLNNDLVDEDGNVLDAEESLQDFLENVDDDAMLNLALQLSLRDQGGPGTAETINGSEAQLSTTVITSSSAVFDGGESASQVAGISSTPSVTRNRLRIHRADQEPIASSVAETNISNTASQQATKPDVSVVSVGITVQTDSSTARKHSSSSSGKSSVGSSSNLNVSCLFEACSVSSDPETESNASENCSFSSYLGDDDEDAIGDSDGDDPEPGQPISASASRDRISFAAARVCVVLTRELAAQWEANVLANTIISGKQLVPLFQTICCLSRLLHAVGLAAVAINSELHDDTSVAAKRMADDWTALDIKAREELKNLLTSIAKGVLHLITASPPGLERKVPSECLLICVRLLAHLLIQQQADSPHTLEDGEKDGEDGFGFTASEALGLLEPSSLRTQCLDTCLHIVETCSAHFRRRCASTGDDDEWVMIGDKNNHGSSIEICDLQSFSLPRLTSGLMQASVGVNFATLTYGYGAGAVNWSPLLDGQTSLDGVHDPLSTTDFSALLIEAGIRLASALLPHAKQHTPQYQRESNVSSKWCLVAYNLLELLATPATSNDHSPHETMPVRISGLLRSLLVQLVGSKPYRHLRDIHQLAQIVERLRSICGGGGKNNLLPAASSLPDNSNRTPELRFPFIAISQSPELQLSYCSECAVLSCLEACLKIATSHNSLWQRFCVRSPDILVFLLNMSLSFRKPVAKSALSLVHIAVAPLSSEKHHLKETSTTTSTTIKTSGAVSRGASSSSSNVYYMKLASSLALLLVPVEECSSASSNDYPQLRKILRFTLCACPDASIRRMSLGIMFALYRHGHETFRLALFRQLPKLWSDMPAFSAYADEFVHLSGYLVTDKPLWPGCTYFLRQVYTLLSRCINSLTNHPKRATYTMLMRFVQPGNATVENISCAENNHHLQSSSSSRQQQQLIPSCFPLELEPCLMCHREAFDLDKLPFSLLHWDSNTLNWRRAHTSMAYPQPTHHTRFISDEWRTDKRKQLQNVTEKNTKTSTSSSEGRQRSNEAAGSSKTQASEGGDSGLVKAMPIVYIDPHTWASSNIHVFGLSAVHAISLISIKFSPSSSTPRLVRTLNIYSCAAFDRIPSRLMHERQLWNRVAQVHLSPTQRNVCINLGPIGPQPLPSSFSSSSDESGGSTVTIDVGSGLSLIASSLIFEYADLHPVAIDSNRKRICPRCRNVLLSGGNSCQMCKQNKNQCSRCLFINLSEEVFLCSNCGSSNVNSMMFSLVARPCYSAVETLIDDEDREAALKQIVKLTDDLASTTQSLARTAQLDLNSILISLISTDANCPSTAVTSSDINITGRLHPELDRLAFVLSEAQACSLDASIHTCRLWAMRQAVAEYDSMATTVINNSAVANPPPSSNTVCSEENSFGSSLGSCYRCLLSSVAHSCDLLHTFASFDARHSSPHITDPTSLPPTNHWLLSETTGGHETQLKQLITDIVVSGLASCPQMLQKRLRELVVSLTRDSISLITHLGDLLFDRLVATAACQGEQAYALPLLCQQEMALLQGSVFSILPSTLFDRRRGPLDRSAACWEARLRPVFKLLSTLTSALSAEEQKNKNKKQQHSPSHCASHCHLPPVPVVRSILVPCVTILETLAKAVPLSSSSSSVLLLRRSVARSGSDGGSVGRKISDISEKAPSRRSRPDFALPPVNFKAWLRGDKSASYAAWRERKDLIRKTVVPSSVSRPMSMTSRDDFLTAMQKSPLEASQKVFVDKQRQLVARCARRWRRATLEAKWATKWATTSNSYTSQSSVFSSKIPMDDTSWMTPIIFSPSDLLAQNQRACMCLLKALSTTPSLPHSSSFSSFETSHPNLSVFLQRRRQAAICYLTSTVLPRLDELVPARGSAAPKCLLSCSGDLVVDALWDLATMEEESQKAKPAPSASHHVPPSGATVTGRGSRRSDQARAAPVSTNTANQLATSSSVLDLESALVTRPFLLVKANLIRNLDPLLKRTLAQLLTLEGKQFNLSSVDDTSPAQSSVMSADLLRPYIWSDCLPVQLTPGSGSGALVGANPGYTLKLVADVLRLLQPMKELGDAHQNQLVRYLLHICVQLRPLIFQRTAYTAKAEQLYTSMLDQLAGVSGQRVDQFLWTSVDFLAQYPVGDQASAAFLLERICAPVCPLSVEIPPFQVKVKVWANQEDYLFARRTSEVIRSDTRGFGPRIFDVINYICTENNLTTEMRLEIVCENQILMPQLRLQDVYTQVWLANPRNTINAMELIYRIPGLEEDHLAYIEHLPTPPVPPEQYSHLSVLAEHPRGLADILDRMDTVKDALKGRDLLLVSVHILEYCLKIPDCLQKLVDPELRAIPILLGTLSACLSVIRLPPGHYHSDFHDQVTDRLVRVLNSLLKLSTSGVVGEEEEDLVSHLFVLIAAQPDLPVVRTHVSRLPALLVFDNGDRMQAICDFLKPHVTKIMHHTSGEPDPIMECCCALVTSIPNETRDGRQLRHRLVTDLQLLSMCVDFLWRTVPEDVLTQSDESALDTKEATLTVFLSESALPFVLKLMRGCIWTQSDNGDDPVSPLFPSSPCSSTTRQDTRRLLAFLHKLETSKSVGQVGLLAEDLLNEWVSTVSGAAKVKSPTPLTSNEAQHSSSSPLSIAEVIQSINELRQLTVQRNRRLAKDVRLRQLHSLNMKVNEKGQVAMSAPESLAKMTAEVVEETGLQCAICHEGPRSAPLESLGIYVFIRRCQLEEGLSRPDLPSSPVPKSPLASSSDGYTTVSSFVLVHHVCHSNAVKASNMSEWTVAARHNRDARCNCLVPVLSRVPPSTPPPEITSQSSEELVETSKSKNQVDIRKTLDDKYTANIVTCSSSIMSLVSLNLSTRLAVHDVKLLLLRFAHARSFHGETGGGAKESNMNLLPHLIQVVLYEMTKERVAVTEKTNLFTLISRPESFWSSDSSACWDTSGPLYSLVIAFHLLSARDWAVNRAGLLRHLMALAFGRATFADDTPASSFNFPPPSSFNVYKPYLLFFALINSLYAHLFKNVTVSVEIDSLSSDDEASVRWRTALSDYIRSSDEELLSGTPKLLAFFESDILPVESMSEFLDVVEMTGEVDPDELIRLATTGKRAAA